MFIFARVGGFTARGAREPLDHDTGRTLCLALPVGPVRHIFTFAFRSMLRGDASRHLFRFGELLGRRVDLAGPIKGQLSSRAEESTERRFSGLSPGFHTPRNPRRVHGPPPQSVADTQSLYSDLLAADLRDKHNTGHV